MPCLQSAPVCCADATGWRVDSRGQRPGSRERVHSTGPTWPPQTFSCCERSRRSPGFRRDWGSTETLGSETRVQKTRKRERPRPRAEFWSHPLCVCAHTLTPIHTDIHTLTLMHSHSHMHTPPHSCTHTHMPTHACSHSHSLMHSHNHTLIHTLTLARSHTHSHFSSLWVVWGAS